MQCTPFGRLLPWALGRQLLPVPPSPRPNDGFLVTLAWQLRWSQGSPIKRLETWSTDLRYFHSIISHKGFHKITSGVCNYHNTPSVELKFCWMVLLNLSIRAHFIGFLWYSHFENTIFAHMGKDLEIHHKHQFKDNQRFEFVITFTFKKNTIFRKWKWC